MNFGKFQRFSQDTHPDSDSSHFPLLSLPPSLLARSHHDVNLIGDVHVARYHRVGTLPKIEVLKETVKAFLARNVIQYVFPSYH